MRASPITCMSSVDPDQRVVSGLTCIYVAKTKALISFAVTAKLICIATEDGLRCDISDLVTRDILPSLQPKKPPKATEHPRGKHMFGALCSTNTISSFI